MVDGAVGRADRAAGDARHQLLAGHLDVDGGIDLLAAAGQRLVEGLGLGDRAREAVQDRTAGSLGLAQLLHEHVDGDVVGDQLAAVHVGLGPLAQRRAVAQGRAEQVAGGQVRDAQVSAQRLGLGALAGGHRADQQQDLAWTWPGCGSGRLAHRMNPS